MKTLATYIVLVMLMATAGCSVGRKLPAGEKLYNGASIRVEKNEAVKESNRSLRKQLEAIAVPHKNKMIFGFPYKLWWWYKIGEPKRQSGLRFWLRSKLGEPPVLSSQLNASVVAANMQAYLENQGYFGTVVIGDSLISGNRIKGRYRVRVNPPYFIGAVHWATDSSQLAKSIAGVLRETKSLLQPGQQFNLDRVLRERSRINDQLKTRGYYFFNDQYLKALADTNNQDRSLSLYMTIKGETPPEALIPFRIEKVIVFPNYNLINPSPDTSLSQLIPINGIYVRDTVRQFKPGLFAANITYRPGEWYNINEQNKTLNRFINLGTFKFVKNRFEAMGHTDTAGLLRAYYYLTPARRKNIQAEIGGFSKSNSFTGGQLNLNWRNGNLFKKAENLTIKTYGAFEVSLSDSLKANNNWRAGAEISLTLPRFLVPFAISGRASYPPRTRFVVGYEWLRRQKQYTKNFFKLHYELNWRESISKEHTLVPVSIVYNNTKQVTNEFDALLLSNPSLQYANYPELIAGSLYNFSGTSVFSGGRNNYYLGIDAELAGTLSGLIRNPDSSFDKKIAGAYFAQYAKAKLELRYIRKVSDNLDWANRFILGAGFPYGNSAFLPFSRQFIIGGAKSLRGFRPRGIGPGSTRASTIQQAYLPQIGGDYKLEFNTEFRVSLSRLVKTAVFIDGGNIWTKDSRLFGPGSTLTGQFMRELAINTGAGVRLDLGILVFCVDIGFPLTKPWLPVGERWVVPAVKFGQPEWRRDNLILNIAIGYPF